MMRASRAQALETRRRILETAVELFRAKGFDGVGVVEIMNAAGLTHGGFYVHFASKAALVAAASSETLSLVNSEWAAVLSNAEGHEFSALLRHLLTSPSPASAGAGLGFALLASDAARHGGEVQTEFSAGLRALTTLLEGYAPAPQGESRLQAIGVILQIVGALILSAAESEPDRSRAILTCARSLIQKNWEQMNRG